jgi:hypothetical protein
MRVRADDAQHTGIKVVVRPRRALPGRYEPSQIPCRLLSGAKTVAAVLERTLKDGTVIEVIFRLRRVPARRTAFAFTRISCSPRLHAAEDTTDKLIGNRAAGGSGGLCFAACLPPVLIDEDQSVLAVVDLCHSFGNNKGILFVPEVQNSSSFVRTV